MADKVTVWDNAGVERLVEPIDAAEIVEAGGSRTAPKEMEVHPVTIHANEEVADEKPATKSKTK